jgi:dCTP deaminase
VSVLVDRNIRELVNSNGLVEPFDESCLQAASYDLRVGRQYVRGGQVELLADSAPTYRLEPGDFAILTSLESLNLPLNIVGHNGLVSYWARRGLVTLFSPQIDPGFQGILYVPVFNAGDAAIPVTVGDKFFTVEFLRTTTKASYGWSERHGRQDRIQNLMVPSANRSNLADISRIEREVSRLEEVLRRLEGDTRTAGMETTSKLAELSSGLVVLENRINDWMAKRTLQLEKRTLLVGLLALVVGIASSPIVFLIWRALDN